MKGGEQGGAGDRVVRRRRGVEREEREEVELGKGGSFGGKVRALGGSGREEGEERGGAVLVRTGLSADSLDRVDP